MKRVEAQISDANYAKVKESGMSAYQFVQDAVAEKISRIEREQELELFKKEIGNHLEDFEKRLEVKIVEQSVKMRKEFIENTKNINIQAEEALRKYPARTDENNRILENIQRQIEEIFKTKFVQY